MDLFFVLSGFLITDILLRTRAPKDISATLYPAYSPHIPAVLRCIDPVFPGHPRVAPLQVQFEYYHHAPSLAWLHLQNWLYIAHIPPNDLMLMGHFWSLSVEEQFYLVWPFVVCLQPPPKDSVTYLWAAGSLCAAPSGFLVLFWRWVYQFSNAVYDPDRRALRG